MEKRDTIPSDDGNGGVINVVSFQSYICVWMAISMCLWLADYYVSARSVHVVGSVLIPHAYM